MEFVSRQVFLFLLATSYSKHYEVLHSEIFSFQMQMSLGAPVQLRVPKRHVWHVDLSDIYLKSNSVSKYFPPFFFFSQMKLFGLQVFICRCCQDQRAEIKTRYRLLVTGFNRMPQLCVKSWLWHSPAVNVSTPPIPCSGSQQWMLESFTCCSHDTAPPGNHWLHGKGHFMDGKPKHTEKVIYPGESQRCRIRHNEIQSFWPPGKTTHLQAYCKAHCGSMSLLTIVY